MSTCKARAIILRSYKLGEADKIMKMYSKDGQVISAVAKGSRKIKSRFGGRLELFNMADLELTQGRELDIINQVEIVHCFSNISQDFYKFVFAEIISNIILRTQSPGDKNTALFKLLYVCLNEIDNTSLEDTVSLKKILCFFDMKFLQLTGFAPMMDSCSVCNRDPGDLYVIDKKDIYFSVSHGGILCGRCSGSAASKVRLGTSGFRLLSDLFRLKIEDLRNMEPDPYSLKRIYRLLEDYIVYHTDCTVDSFRYLKKIGI